MAEQLPYILGDITSGTEKNGIINYAEQEFS